MDGSTYATLKASIDRKPTYIGSRIQYYFDSPKESVADQLDFRFAEMPAEPEAFGELQDAADIINAPAETFYMPRMHEEQPLSALESRRLDQVAKAATDLKASAEAAILTEILETDLPNKTIAIDDLRLRSVVEKSGLDLQIVDGERLIRRMRMIKSPLEIEYMRFAAEANSLAAKAAARSVREGANFNDVRNEFAKACAEQGTRAKFMMLDTHTPTLTEGEIKDGRSFLMDAVSTFEEYHGDYGRTVCLGEPNSKMQQVIDGLSATWDRVFPELKPGVTYRDIFELTMRLYGEVGLDVGYAVNPHNVGMHHHDEPNAIDFALGYTKDNITLQEGMIIRSNLKGVYYLRDLADAEAIKKNIKLDSKAVIIGGGYIGLETAALLRKIGLEVCILETMDRVLQRVTSEEISAFYARVHSEEGVHIKTNVMATEILGSDKVEAVRCNTGEEIAADLVIIGIGVIPNTELAEDCGVTKQHYL
eukprot:g4347.t1